MKENTEWSHGLEQALILPGESIIVVTLRHVPNRPGEDASPGRLRICRCTARPSRGPHHRPKLSVSGRVGDAGWRTQPLRAKRSLPCGGSPRFSEGWALPRRSRCQHRWLAQFRLAAAAPAPARSLAYTSPVPQNPAAERGRPARLCPGCWGRCV